MSSSSLRSVLILGFAAFLSLSSFKCQTEKRGETIVVFSASSLTDVTDSLFIRFQSQHPGTKILKSDAGSSLLARQIESGASFDLFLSASSMWTQRVTDGGFLSEATSLIHSNELVVILNNSSRYDSIGLASPVALLRDAKTISIGDPVHVPAGMYAQEALTCLGLWQDVERKIIPTLDVRAALLAVLSGAAGAGIVYVTDTIGRDLSTVRIGRACQPEITYTIGMSNSQSMLKQELYDFVNSIENSDVWEHYGFLR